MSNEIVLSAVKICEYLLKVMRERDIEAVDFAIVALKLPRARDPAATIAKLVLLLNPHTRIEIINLAAKKLVACKRRLKAIHTDSQLVAIAAGGYEVAGEPEVIGGSSYITGAAAASELQRQYVRAELHRDAGTIYQPPEYTGAEEAVTQYGLDAVLELEKANLAEVLRAAAKYADEPTPIITTYETILQAAESILAAVKARDAAEMRAALTAESQKLAAAAYCNQLATHIRQDIEAVHPYKTHARARHQLKKAIAGGIDALRAALAIPLPAPDELPNPPPDAGGIAPSNTAGIEAHYEALKAYFRGEYARMPWFQALEAHLNSVAKLAADLRESWSLLISPEHLDTCLKRQIALYTVILDAQHLARHFNKAEYRQLLEYNFSKFPKLVVKGKLVPPK